MLKLLSGGQESLARGPCTCVCKGQEGASFHRPSAPVHHFSWCSLWHSKEALENGPAHSEMVPQVCSVAGRNEENWEAVGSTRFPSSFQCHPWCSQRPLLAGGAGGVRSSQLLLSVSLSLSLFSLHLLFSPFPSLFPVGSKIRSCL